MSLTPGDSYACEFVTSSPTTLAAANADSLPVATANRNGADDSAFTLTVANLATGRYKVTGTVPAGYAAGDTVSVSVAATVGGVAGVGVVDAFVLDGYRLADLVGGVLPDVDAGVAGGLTVVGGAPPAGTDSGGVVISGVAAYCSADQFLTFYDWRSVGKLLEDLEAAGTPTLTSRTAVAGSSALALVLQRASGKVEKACFKGGRYTAADLIALGATNAGIELAGTVADLAMWEVFKRRPDRDAKKPEACGYAEQVLAQLADGEMIWPLQQVADAGHLNSETIDPRDVEARNDRTVAADRYFGMRNDRERPYRR